MTSWFSTYTIHKVLGWPGAYIMEAGPDHIARHRFGTLLGPEVERLILPETVEQLDAGCFENRGYLREVWLPDSVKSIGKRAFAGCRSLERISIPASVRKLGKIVCFGCNPKNVSLPSRLLPEGLTPEEVLGIPDADGFIGEGNTLWSYVGPERSSLVVPDKYVRVQWESLGDRNGPSFEELLLPDRLEYLDIPLDLAKRVSFPPKYLQRQDFLPVRLTGSLICGGWRAELEADDVAALFLFQKPTLSGKALDESARFSRLDFAAAILNMLPKSDVRESWKRASVWMTGFDFGPDDEIGREFANRMRAALGMASRDVWPAVWDFALERAGVRLTREAAQSARRAGSRSKAPDSLVKAAFAPYAARGSDICRNASLELGPFRHVAEDAASQLDASSLSAILGRVLPYALSGDPQHVIPYIRYGDDKQMRDFLRPCAVTTRSAAIRHGNCCNRGESCLLWKRNLVLSDTPAALEFVMRTNDCADAANRSLGHPLDLYLRERRGGKLPALEFGAAGGERTYLDDEGRTVLALLVRDGEIRFRLPGRKETLREPPESLGLDEETEKKIRRDIRRTYRIRDVQREAVRDLIADRWIDGKTYDPPLWRAVFGEQFYASSAAGVVWTQGEGAFILTDAGPVDVAGESYRLDENAPVSVAYPSEMEPGELSAWRRKLREIKKPVLPQQLDDPVYTERDATPERYAGCVVAPKSLKMERDRVFVWDILSGRTGSLRNGGRIEIDPDARGWGPGILPERPRLGVLHVRALDRETNHLLYLLDLLTLESRFERDDASLAPLLLGAGDDEMRKWRDWVMETEGLVKLRALVLQESDRRFGRADLTEEFALR